MARNLTSLGTPRVKERVGNDAILLGEARAINYPLNNISDFHSQTFQGFNPSSLLYYSKVIRESQEENDEEEIFSR